MSALTHKGEDGNITTTSPRAAATTRAPRPDPLAHLTGQDPGQAMVNLGKDVVSKVEPFLTFYAYRAAAGKDDDELENSVVMDLAATLTYLHTHVVSKDNSTTRLYGIDRIKRWKVTMRTTREYFNAKEGRNFGWLWDFEGGKCVDPRCEAFYRHFGLIVGCGWAPIEDAMKAAYQSFPELEDFDNINKHLGVRWSLPGECPSRGRDGDEQCRQSLPGGRCSVAIGAPDCSWSAQEAGEVMLDELAGIAEYGSFVASGGYEYDPDTDSGFKSEFWDGMGDREKCAYRLAQVEQKFAEEFPEHATSMVEPECDMVDVPDGELAIPVNHSGAMQPLRTFVW